jgi:hypothetical protein
MLQLIPRKPPSSPPSTMATTLPSPSKIGAPDCPGWIVVFTLRMLVSRAG